ncbi:MAG: type II toxin-antitoxin system prevent-host-death family antitoxin [Acidobacteriota bacterium]
MTTVGVRELRSSLSSILGRVQNGERLLITERARPIALLTPAPVNRMDDAIDGMVRRGEADWSGGKPRGSRRPPRVAGAAVSDTVIEDRT